MDEKEILINSGYPLQIAIEHLVKKPSKEIPWAIITREKRWFNKMANEGGFIDLVLTYQSQWSRAKQSLRMQTRLIVECKRYDGIWYFLIPSTENRSQEKSWLLHHHRKAGVLYWEEMYYYPPSEEAPFCIPMIKNKTEYQKDTRTLENISGEVLLSLESCATEEGKIDLRKIGHNYYLPVIVTTAALKCLVVDPATINLEDGTFPVNGSKDVSWIRFRKNLGLSSISNLQPSSFSDMSELSTADDRTIYIVQANEFVNFLKVINDVYLPEDIAFS